MNRPLLLLPAGLVLGLAAFALAYWLQTRPARALLGEPHGDLAWLRTEFALSESQLERIVALHESYEPACDELCSRVSESNERLLQAAASTNLVTARIRELVAETGRARDECRLAMLDHLYKVAAELPPAAGARYLNMMLAATCVIEQTRHGHTEGPGVHHSPPEPRAHDGHATGVEPRQ